MQFLENYAIQIQFLRLGLFPIVLTSTIYFQYKEDKIMSKNQNNETINTIISLVDTPEQYVHILTEGTLRSSVDKRVCSTLYQLAGNFLLEQKMEDSAYYVIDPTLSAIENQKETQARLRDLQHILANRAIAIFYLNSQNNYDFGAFQDIEEDLYTITSSDYWFILQEPEWKLVLSTLQSDSISQELRQKLKKILEAFCLHLYAFLVKKDSLYKEHKTIAKVHQMQEDISQMGYEALLRYLENFDTTKPGNPYNNHHIIKNEINSKMNDYSQPNRNDRTRRASWSRPGKIDYKSEILRTCSLDEYILQDDNADDTNTVYEAVLLDKLAEQGYEDVEVMEDFKKLYNSLDTPLEKIILCKLYFEKENFTYEALLSDLGMKSGKFKKIREKIERKAIKLGIKKYAN